MRIRWIINWILRPLTEWRIGRSVRRIEREIGMVIIGMLLLIVAHQSIPPDRVRCWLDLDNDGIPEVIVIYQFVKTEGTRVEVGRETVPRLPDDSIRWNNPIKGERR